MVTPGKCCQTFWIFSTWYLNFLKAFNTWIRFMATLLRNSHPCHLKYFTTMDLREFLSCSNIALILLCNCKKYTLESIEAKLNLWLSDFLIFNQNLWWLTFLPVNVTEKRFWLITRDGKKLHEKSPKLHKKIAGKMVKIANKNALIGTNFSFITPLFRTAALGSTE